MNPEKPIIRLEEDAEEIQGDNFVMGGKDRKPSHSRRSFYDTSVEFRSDATNADKIKNKEDTIKKEEERTKDLTLADNEYNILNNILDKRDTYSETFKIKPDGSFDTERLDGSPVLIYVNNPVELYQIARDIEDKHSEMKFSFQRDHEGRWMKYIVTKKKEEEV